MEFDEGESPTQNKSTLCWQYFPFGELERSVNHQHHKNKQCVGETFIEERTDAEYTSYLYNGKELDAETGLYYYGARYYDPQISMWYGVDPLAEKFIESSPFGYVRNNPIIKIDPDGRDEWTVNETTGEAKYTDNGSDNITINNTPIEKYKFDSQEKLNALATIGGYYNDQNGGSENLYNNKILVLSYEKYRLTASSNWDLDKKPRDKSTAPLMFAYSAKQFGTAEDRIAITVEDGFISSSLKTKWNFRNALVHENVHLGQPLDKYDYKTYAPYFELSAYKTQMKHGTWSKTTEGYQKYMLSNTVDYLNRLKLSSDPSTIKVHNEYQNFFNKVRK